MNLDDMCEKSSPPLRSMSEKNGNFAVDNLK